MPLTKPPSFYAPQLHSSWGLDGAFRNPGAMPTNSSQLNMTFSLSRQIPALQLEVIYQPGASLQVHRKQTWALSHALLCFTFKVCMHVCMCMCVCENQRGWWTVSKLCPYCVWALIWSEESFTWIIAAESTGKIQESNCKWYQRVLVFMRQALQFYSALWYHVATVSPVSSLWSDLSPHPLTLKCPRLAWVMACAERVKVEGFFTGVTVWHWRQLLLGQFWPCSDHLPSQLGL